MKKLIAATGIVVALGTGAFALNTVLPAGAQSDPGASSAAPGGHDRGARAKAALDGLVADGTLTQAQEDKVVEALKNAAPKGGKGAEGRRHEILAKAVETSAQALGMSTDDLKTELMGGKSVADVATEKGVPLDTVTQALTSAANTAIDKAVADGKLTQERADAMRAKLPDAITKFENATRHDHGAHPGHDSQSGSNDSSSSSTSS
ncbi:MAG: hypothetical protein ACR2LQ_07525 [Acidimicrobiales bacterium]